MWQVSESQSVMRYTSIGRICHLNFGVLSITNQLMIEAEFATGFSLISTSSFVILTNLNFVRLSTSETVKNLNFSLVLAKHTPRKQQLSKTDVNVSIVYVIA